MEHAFLLLAGDARLRCLRDLLQKEGKTAVHLSACRSSEALQAHIAAVDSVVLPVPVTKDGVHLFCAGEECMLLSDVFGALQKGQRVFGGAFSASQKAQIAAQGASALDFLQDAPFVLQNAAFTAQGALRLILEHTTVPLQGLPVLITGFGKVGKATAMLLKNVGCAVTVAARNETQRAEAALSGCRAVSLAACSDTLQRTAVVVNTVPAKIFSPADLQRCKENALFLELASAPFGAAAQDVREAGLHHVPGGSLPGKYCAAGCAAAMLRLVIRREEVIS